MMRTQTIAFQEQQARCVFPDELSNLPEAISALQLQESYPVIVLIGGVIDEHQAKVTHEAIQVIARLAEDIHAVVLCGGTDMGVMAEIGQIRAQNNYKFPLVGVTLEALVSWPAGPQSTNLLWWGTKRWKLEPHYSHFILVPGSQFGDESPWIVDIATRLSNGLRSVTILINGGEVSRKDIDLSMEHGRPVIALSRTGRLADDLTRETDRNKLISIIPANAEDRIVEAIRTALTPAASSAFTPATTSET